MKKQRGELKTPFSLSSMRHFSRWETTERLEEVLVYKFLLKTGSLDNAIREFSLAKPSWYMSHYTMIYKNGERMREFLGLFVFVVV